MEGILRKSRFSPLTVRSLVSSNELCSWQSEPEEPHPFPYLLICSSHGVTTLPPTGAQARHCLLEVSQTHTLAGWHHPPACKKSVFCSIPRDASPVVPSFFQQEPWKREMEALPPPPSPPPPIIHTVYSIMSLHLQRV